MRQERPNRQYGTRTGRQAWEGRFGAPTTTNSPKQKDAQLKQLIILWPVPNTWDGTTEPGQDQRTRSGPQNGARAAARTKAVCVPLTKG